MDLICRSKQGQRMAAFLVCLLVAACSVDDARALPLVTDIRKNGPETAAATAGGVGSNASDDAMLGQRVFAVIRTTAKPTPLRVTALATAGQADIGLRLAKRSVVEDWSSLCEHLCRTGFGGGGCGGRCGHSDVIQLLPTQADDSFLSMCPLLCSVQLGYPKCQCTTDIVHETYDIDSEVKNDICSIGCASQATLSGCTQCLPDDALTVIEVSSTQFGEESVSTDSDFTTEFKLNSTEMPSTTITAATTTVKPTTTTTKKPTTTPNWSEHCTTLCRIGEGGSLCNCDLPPFF